MLHFRLSASSSMNSSSSTVRRLVGSRSLSTTTTARYAARGGRMNERSQQVWDATKGIVFSGEVKGNVGYAPMPVRGYATSPEVRPAEAEGTEARAAVENESFERKVEEMVEVVVEKVETVVVKTGEGQEKTESGEGKTEEDIHTVLTPPYTPLDFKIPDDIFLAAKKAPEGSSKSYWNYQMYRGPTGKEKVKVHYCVSPDTTERVIQRYFLNEPILGFDLEWASDALPFQGARRNVSLIQIASPTRIALFHVALYPKRGPIASPLLKKILEDPNVTKVGVWIVGDANRVQKHLNIIPRGIFELSHLYKLVKYCESGEHSLINKKLVSLGKQAEQVLKLPLYKELDVRASDWSKSLKLDQIIYSASDAYAGVQIYSMLNHQRLQLDPCPPLPHHAELKLPIELPDHTVLPAATEGDEIEMTPAEAAETVPKPKKTRAPPAPKREKHPLVSEADIWVSQYRISHPPSEDAATYAKPSELRAYYLWHHNPDLDIEAVCALLRDPPFQIPTVISYIVRSIKIEDLLHDKERLLKLLEARQQSVPPGDRFVGQGLLKKLKGEEGAALAEKRREDIIQDEPIQEETVQEEAARRDD
ncbi:putative Werner syndrome ATP-dependent helicase [Triangularia setosa]|uniref:Werner syndrome ATP-dependent helicase n=1 Tax=Triangularia setosa TaxID=2587417 RepID=A0AAN6W1P7_9PEZI|nr:putative Werner syndrome ATP-dependent helicase [Podospora setosa]